MGLKEQLLDAARNKLGRHREEVTPLLVAAGWEKSLAGCKVYAQRMSGKARSTYEDYRDVYGPDPEKGFGAVKRTGLNLKNIQAQLCVRCLAAETGDLLFAESDADSFGEADSELLANLYEVCLRVNGWGGEERPLAERPFAAGSGSPPAPTA